ncbi:MULTISPECIES: hypothetical protein [Kitasatospora]|uniref:Uncharacterized protein n=3 Tax=Kitasatospora TaxID=2063 RepID=A0ABT1J343_9ACTN|nr:hypothetical protein [Kitasatospora paracochleata]MCP2311850.1 hypothetical protein [Kitasatospora paracochleata]
MRRIQHDALDRAIGGDLAAGYGPRPPPSTDPQPDPAAPAPETRQPAAA